MPGRGPVPKPDDQRQRRNATVPMTELELGTTPIKAPALPRRSKMLKETRDWYDAWCRSPQASQFTGPTWTRLHMLAIVVDAFFRTGDKGLLGEIRLNETELGATPASMQRLRWTYKGESSRPAAATAAKKRKQRSDPRLRLVR